MEHELDHSEILASRNSRQCLHANVRKRRALSRLKTLFTIWIGFVLGWQMASTAVCADLLFTLSADGGGTQDVSGDGWWQHLDYNSHIRLLFKLKSPVRIGDMVECRNADVTGNIRFYGRAEDHFFGTTEILDFNLDRYYDLRGKGLYFYYWVGSSNVDYIGLPLNEAANPPNPRLDGLKFMGDLGIVTNIAVFPSFWWFDHYFPVYATASLVTNATDFHGHVQDECSGAPLSGAVAELRCEYGTFTAQTGVQGDFVVTQIPPGPLTVTVSRAGYNTYSTTKPLPPATTVNVTLKLTPFPTKIDPLLAINASRHHTDGFVTTNMLIARRGTNIAFQWHLTPGQRLEDYSLALVVRDQMGNPLPPITNAIPPASTASDQWWARHLNTFQGPGGGLIAGFEVHVPPNAPVGKYNFTLYCKPPTGTNSCSVAFPVPVVVLFNPWCGDDPVYMAGNLERTEYLLREDGLLFRRKDDRATKVWYFDQFHTNTLTVFLQLIGTASLDDRRVPALVIRKLRGYQELRSASDGQGPGVLWGRWANLTETDVQRLGAWSASDQIFQKYLQTSAPVDFGQCWIFSGLLTSLLRCAGIPARPVTNFESPEDHDHNGVVDVYWLDGQEVRFLTGVGASDSPWNFHVWCEAWMKHPDYARPAEWQAVDGTEYLGPAPRTGIRDDHQGNYEVQDFFVAVAGPVTNHFYATAANGLPVFVRDVLDPNRRIGTGTCTMSVDSCGRELIGQAYEVSPSARLRRVFPKDGDGLGGLEIQFSPPEEVSLGSNVVLVATLKNTNGASLKARAILSSAIIQYNGEELQSLPPAVETNVVIAPAQQVSIQRIITPDEYYSWTSTTRFLRASLYVENVSTTDLFGDSRTISLVSPALATSLSSSQVRTGAVVQCQLAWSNSLPVALSNATLRVSLGNYLLVGGSPGFTLDLGTLAPGQNVLVTTNLLAVKPGRCLIASSLNADTVGTIDGYNYLRVGPPLQLRLRLDSQGRPVLMFPTVGNEVYRVEANNSLAPSDWQATGEDFIGNNQDAEITLQMPVGAGSQFYRVRIVN